MTRLATGPLLCVFLALAGCASPGRTELVPVTPDWPGLDFRDWVVPEALATGFGETRDRTGCLVQFEPGDRLLYAIELRNGEERERWLLELEVTSGFAADLMEIDGETQFHLPTATMTMTSSQDEQEVVVSLKSNLYLAAIRLFDARGALLGESSIRVPHLIGGGILEGVETMQVMEEAGERVKRGESVELVVNEELLEPLARAQGTISSVFQIVDEDELLRPILMRAASPPSIWSVVAHLGLTLRYEVDFSRTEVVELPPSYLPPRDEYRAVPMQITANGEVVLDLEILATEPALPLLPCGGLVGLVGRSPKHEDRQVEVALIGAHCALATDEAR